MEGTRTITRRCIRTGNLLIRIGLSESLKHKTVSGVTWSFVDNIANQGIT